MPPRLSAAHGSWPANRRRAGAAGRRIGGAEIVDDGRLGAFADAERVADLQRVVRRAVVREGDAVRADCVEQYLARDGADRVAERFADRRVQRADRERFVLRRRVGCQDRVAQRRLEPDRGEPLARNADALAVRGDVANRDVDAVERRTGDRAGDLHARTP